MDGLTATRQIKASPDLNDIPVIALTGYAMEEDRINSLAAGCIDFITKPIDTHGFMEKIKNPSPGPEERIVENVDHQLY